MNFLSIVIFQIVITNIAFASEDKLLLLRNHSLLNSFHGQCVEENTLEKITLNCKDGDINYVVNFTIIEDYSKSIYAMAQKRYFEEYTRKCLMIGGSLEGRCIQISPASIRFNLQGYTTKIHLYPNTYINETVLFYDGNLLKGEVIMKSEHAINFDFDKLILWCLARLTVYW